MTAPGPAPSGADRPPGGAGPLGSALHAAWLDAEGRHLLDFARASEHPDGGFGWLDDAGEPEPDRALDLWITCRMTHVFALGHLLGRPDCDRLVDVGLAALRGRFHDPTRGGWYAQVGADGPVTTAKTAYEHAFVVLAGASATVADRPGADALLDDALGVLLEHFLDGEQGMVREEWDESFTVLDGYRGVNAAMHTVEALIAAADVREDPSLRRKALRILTRVVHDLAPAHAWRIPEHLDDTYTPDLDYHRDQPAHPFRPFGATVGHWLEWCRLAVGLRAALGDDAPGWMLNDARSLFEAAVREGWAVDGVDGFVYTVDFAGEPVVRERMHWVLAEAIGAAAALHAATGEGVYADWYATWWRHAWDHVRDHVRGSWRHELSPDLTPSSTTWAGKPDVYHAFQATLLPRLPLTPSLAVAVRDGLLD